VSKPFISVIIPVYNGERYVAQAVESALAQTYENFELVIINDGSTDQSRQAVARYLERPNVRYIEQENRGVAAARNAGIRAASGELIGFLDQDDLWLPEKLAVQVAYLDEHPDIPLVHANQDHIDGDGKPIAFHWPTDARGHCFKELFIENRIAVLTVLVRRRCLDEVGPLNERVSIADDYELWLRIARRYPIGHIDRVLARYRFHDRNVSRDLFRMTRTDLAAIESIVAQYPDVYRTIGRRAVNARRAQLHYELGGWHMWKARDLQTARRHFFRAIRLRPDHLPSYGRFLWCSLTFEQHRALAWYWHKLKTVAGAAKS
jgi:glycosyltransferase involved in cell wall biosynthesis